MPNMPNYRLGAWNGSPCDTLKTSSVVEILGVPEPTIRIFPNPNNGRFMVSTGKGDDKAIDVQWVIHNMAGRLHGGGLSSKPEFEISSENLPAGIYLLTIRDKTGRWLATERFTVMRE